jgi:hypothetical protein
MTNLEEEFDLYLTYTDSDGNDRLVWFYPYTGKLREEGLFPPEELQIYRAEMPIQLSTIYKLYLHLKESDYIVYAELNSFERKFSVLDPLQVDFRTINLYTDEDYYFRFKPVAPRAVYQSIMYFNYTEYINDITVSKSLPFVLDITFGEENDNVFVVQRLSGEYFLREVGRRLHAGDGIVRVAAGLDFHLSAGGEELYYMIKSVNRQFGFSALSSTNLENGIGVFSSLSHRYVKGIPLSVHTIDSLAYSQYTEHLGFLPYSRQLP